MNFRFSGHETFPCRYAWLPKAFIAIEKTPQIFSDENQAMVVLGVGKNMMRAIRFWVQATGIAKPVRNNEITITDFGKQLLARDGLDPFLEDRRTLWLIHWKLSSHVEEPLFAWDFLLNRWATPEISRAEVLRAFEHEAQRLNRKLSTVTLLQHLDTFLHTYVPTRSRKGDVQEDNLDSPLVELELIQKIGERDSGDAGKRETIYAFRREAKPDITPELFIYCLQEFWDKRLPNEKTLSFRDVAIAHGSPGQLFKLPEWEVRERLESIEADSNGYFRYRESASLQHLTRTAAPDLFENDLLAAIYQLEVAHA